MAATPNRTVTSTSTGSNDDGYPGLWPLAAGGAQLSSVHDLRLQLHPSEAPARLAFVRGVLGLSGGPVHRDVRLPADYLSAQRLAWLPLSRARSVYPRCWAPLGDTARLEWRSTPQPAAPSQQRPDLWRLHRHRPCLGRAVSSPASGHAGHHWSIRAGASPPVHRLYRDHARLPAAMAYH